MSDTRQFFLGEQTPGTWSAPCSPYVASAVPVPTKDRSPSVLLHVLTTSPGVETGFPFPFNSVPRFRASKMYGGGGTAAWPDARIPA